MSSNGLIVGRRLRMILTAFGHTDLRDGEGSPSAALAIEVSSDPHQVGQFAA